MGPPDWHGREGPPAAGRRPQPHRCRHGARLARGPWNLPQRGQDLPPVGERGGPDENHLHGEGRRRQGSLLPSCPWHQGCRDSVKAESGKDFALSEQFGYIHSCPTNLGTGMRASVMIDLPGYTKEGFDALKKRCEELAVQPRGTRGESGGF